MATRTRHTPDAPPRGGAKYRQDGSSNGRGTRAYPLPLRMSVVEAVLDHGIPVADVSESFGPSPSALKSWIAKYEEGGAAALVPKKRKGGGTKKRTGAALEKREAVVKVKSEHPEYGTRRIRDVLARFEALGISETHVRRILHEEGLIE